jgi:glutamyl-Q tRNA(Asp) synthetase
MDYPPTTLLTRFAPSPTGLLHLGHAYAAAQVFETAERLGGTALLRIEDIDHTRCKTQFSYDLQDDLAWLGFDWIRPARVQSEHYTDYAKVVIDLVQRGLAYPCNLSRTELKSGLRTSVAKKRSHSQMAQLCDTIQKAARYKTPSLPYAVRLDLKAALKQTDTALTYFEGDATRHGRLSLEAWSLSDRPDPVIARRDIGTSYHIAVTHDDHIQGITDVVRGADFMDQTPLHVLIQTLMGWSTPRYHHHPLVTDETGRKLSKTDKDITIRSLRESGMRPADVLSQAERAL